MRRSRLAKLLAGSLLALAAGLALLGAARAQTAQEAPPGMTTFLDTLEVRVVNVDVVVLDDYGDPVRGLVRDDFEILEDGKPMEITNFAPYEEDAPELASDESVTLTGESAAAATEPVRRPPPATWVVYVDHSRLMPGPRNLILRETKQFLEKSLAPGDRSMVATFDGQSLKLISPLAADPAPALAALTDYEKAAGPAATMRGRASFLQQDISNIDPTARGADAEIEAARREADAMLEEESLKARAAISAFGDLLSILSGIEGRVGLVFGAAGFDPNPVENLFRMLESRFAGFVGQGNRDFDVRVTQARNDYARLLSAVNASRVTVYTVYAGEGRGPDVPSAEVGGAQSVSGPSLNVATSPEGQSALTAFATETGGRAFVAATDLSEGLTTARRDLSTYYSLGYRPDRLDYGEFHEIEVRVKRYDVKVVHRRGVTERTPQEEAASAAVTALLGEGAAPNELGIAIDVGAAQPGRGKSQLVPIVVKVPLRGATLLPEGAGHRAHFEFHFSIRDPDGGFRRLEPRDLAFAVPNDKLAGALGQFVTYNIQLALEPGSYRLGVSAVDRFGGTQGSATAPIEVVKER
jgi:VWFA-related protein